MQHQILPLEQQRQSHRHGNNARRPQIIRPDTQDIAEQNMIEMRIRSDRGVKHHNRIAAAEIIRSLIQDIVLTPMDGKIEIDVRGDLAGILTLSSQKQNPAASAAGLQVKLVAGARTHLYLRRSKTVWFSRLLKGPSTDFGPNESVGENHTLGV